MATTAGILTDNRRHDDPPAAREPVDNGDQIGKVSPAKFILSFEARRPRI